MELAIEPDIYSPSVDEKGNYIDKIPSFSLIKNGLLCPCGSRKDKYYQSHSSFSTHIKTKNHQTWLLNINLNKINYYLENEDERNKKCDVAYDMFKIDFNFEDLCSIFQIQISISLFDIIYS